MIVPEIVPESVVQFPWSCPNRVRRGTGPMRTALV